MRIDMKMKMIALSSALLIAGAGMGFAQTATNPPANTANPPAARTAPMATTTTASPTTKQSASLTSADTQKLGNAWRASKVNGASVYNDQNQKVGSIDDLIIDRNDHVVYAVLSVGGFLGMGNHLVAVPYDQLVINSDNKGKVDKVIMRGATKDSLKAMPEFKYQNV
jgi:sporulation protein YlmC with PRC-barrel domain